MQFMLLSWYRFMTITNYIEDIAMKQTCAVYSWTFSHVGDLKLHMTRPATLASVVKSSVVKILGSQSLELGLVEQATTQPCGYYLLVDHNAQTPEEITFILMYLKMKQVVFKFSPTQQTTLNHVNIDV